MKKRFATMLGVLVSLSVLCALPASAQRQQAGQPVAVAATALPEKFDLRDIGGVTPVKQQLGGTCWTHGTMASLESHMILSGIWQGSGQSGIPSLSEYHLDWWNGFNKHQNLDLTDDNPAKGTTGLTVHSGGDYRVSTAYFSRGEGPVVLPAEHDRVSDKKWHKSAPPLHDQSFRRFYVRDVEWFVVGPNLEGIDAVKRRIMTTGALATAYASGKTISKDFVHYQPPDHKSKPNHSVAIVGWDDAKVGSDEDKRAPKPGAWLIKNSWGTKRGDQGYFWLSYYDKYAGRDPEMGAVSFRNFEPMMYTNIYYHDYHGWRDTLPMIGRAFNAYTATGKQMLRAVSFYTTRDNVSYKARIYSRFENGILDGELTSQEGSQRVTGFHTVNLDTPVILEKDQKFYVYVELSDGGHAIDRTSVIPVLLGQDQQQKQDQKQQDQKKDQGQKKDEQKKKGGKGGKGGGGGLPKVFSKANPGESFYNDGSGWKDLYNYNFGNPEWERTGNFCIKALAVAIQTPTKATTNNAGGGGN